MRKCRKMISVIMLTVMLATLTPFQALAADIPTNGTDETITTVTEPQNEGQEGQKGQEDQTGQGTEDQGTGSDEGKGTDASGETVLTPAIRHLQETRAQILRLLARIL